MPMKKPRINCLTLLDLEPFAFPDHPARGGSRSPRLDVPAQGKVELRSRLPEDPAAALAGGDAG